MQEQFGKPPEAPGSRRVDEGDLATAWASAAATVLPTRTLLPKVLLSSATAAQGSAQPLASPYLPLMGSMGADSLDVPSSALQLAHEEVCPVCIVQLECSCWSCAGDNATLQSG